MTNYSQQDEQYDKGDDLQFSSEYYTGAGGEAGADGFTAAKEDKGNWWDKWQIIKGYFLEDQKTAETKQHGLTAMFTIAPVLILTYISISALVSVESIYVGSQISIVTCASFVTIVFVILNT